MKRTCLTHSIKNFQHIQSHMCVVNSGHIYSGAKINYLGIILDSQLSVKPHFQYLVKSSFRYLCSVNRDKNTLILTYSTWIRSKLEYASVDWSPVFDRLGKIQRHLLQFARFTCICLILLKDVQRVFCLRHSIAFFSLAKRCDVHAAVLYSDYWEIK